MEDNEIRSALSELVSKIDILENLVNGDLRKYRQHELAVRSDRGFARATHLALQDDMTPPISLKEKND
ncbi:MAG: hypothetical protein H0X33_00830 [Taibaiella sp.]|nr:hypothetical protein [Taibaiella sp.]